jgi:cellulose synthase/poly-beta-1,6-N-acetylglucosamine synthase-like glycosyltransferase
LSRIATLVRGHTLFAAVLVLWFIAIAGVWLFSGLFVWTAGLLYVLYDTWLIAYVASRVRALVATGDAPGDRHRASPVQVPAGAGARNAAAGPSLSVLVAARNEGAVLADTLDALLGQVDRPEQIIIADDGSTDATSALLAGRYGVPESPPGTLAQSRLHCTLWVLRKAGSGKADSLNQALRHASAEVIVTLDADTLPDPAALGELRRAFAREPALAAAGGVLSPHCTGGLSGRCFEWFQTFEYVRAFLSRIAWMRADALLLVSGAFAAYRRDVLATLGGFDTSSLVEDYEIIHRLHRHSAEQGYGWRVRVLHAARARTDAPGTLGAFLRQRRRWFAGFLQTQYRYRFMTGNARYGSVGRFMMPIKVIDTLQPLYGLTAFVLLVSFLVGGRSVLWPVLAVIGAKLVVDFCFQLWGLQLYYRWLGRRPLPRDWLLAALASLAEPFSFQLLRHTGALLGWWAVLSRQLDWAPQRAAVIQSPPASSTEAR